MQMEVAKVTMAAFADILTQFMDRPVVDTTELKASYQLSLDVPVQAMTGMNFAAHQGRLDVFLRDLLQIADDANPPGIAVQSEKMPDLLPGFVEANPMPLVPGVIPRIWLGNEAGKIVWRAP